MPVITSSVDMQHPDDAHALPTFDLDRVSPDALARGFREVGFVALRGHGIDRALTDPAYAAIAKLFALPDEVKRTYVVPGGAGARGYTPFRTEHAKDQVDPDLKEFWHVGREREDDPALKPNVWPREVPEFEPAMRALYDALDALGGRVLAALAVALALPADWFADKIDHGNSILRPLHYPPLAPSAEPGVRSAAHEDINLITLMVAAAEPGLEIRDRDGRWRPIVASEHDVIVNIGDMLQRLTNDVLPSTTHRVVNPEGPDGRRARYSMPYFLHPNPDFAIETLPSCVTATRPNRYPTPITADAYLQERLREIGLL
jgi:isopenicillin N synthase-like dioxygenase